MHCTTVLLHYYTIAWANEQFGPVFYSVAGRGWARLGAAIPRFSENPVSHLLSSLCDRRNYSLRGKASLQVRNEYHQCIL